MENIIANKEKGMHADYSTSARSYARASDEKTPLFEDSIRSVWANHYGEHLPPMTRASGRTSGIGEIMMLIVGLVDQSN